MNCELIPTSTRMTKIMQNPEFRRYAARATEAITTDQLTSEEVLAFLRWQQWRRRHGFANVAGQAEFEAYIGPQNNACVYYQLVRAICFFSPGALEVNVLRAARTAWRARQPKANEPERPSQIGPPLRYSLPLSELPATWRKCLDEMEEQRPGSNSERSPAPGRIIQIRRVLCQLGYSAREAGVEIALDQCALSAFTHDLLARNLKSVTIETRLCQLTKFAKYIGADHTIIRLLRRESAFHEKKRKFQVKKKEIFLRQTGMTLETFADAAWDCLNKVKRMREGRAHEQDQLVACRDAALLGLCLAAAPRQADITRLVVGISMKRHASQWEIDYTALKNGVEITFLIDQRLTHFLDQAVLLGADPKHLPKLYKERIGTPFFVRNLGLKPLHVQWPYSRLKAILKTGTHIARTLWFETEAARGAPGLEAALAICGHRSRRTADAYLTARSYIDEASRAREILAVIAAESLLMD